MTSLRHSRGAKGLGGLASILLHLAAMAFLISLARHVPEPPALQESTIEIMFQLINNTATRPEPANEPLLAQPVVAQLDAPLPDPAPDPPVLTPPPVEPVVTPEPLPAAQEQTPPPLPTAEPPEPKPPQLQPPVTLPVARPKRLQPVAKPPPVPTAGPAAGSGVGEAPNVTGPPLPQATGSLVDPAWGAAVRSWLASQKKYPEEARARGEEGTVSIRFTVDRAGRVLDANLANGSGSARLDQATLALLRAAVLPPFPAAMIAERVTITTAVRYTLQ